MNNSIFIGRKIADETRNWLQENSVSFIDKPLIEIEFISPDFSLFNTLKNKSKSWAITSNQAAKWLKKYHAEIGLKSTDSIFCISQKQAENLSDLSSEITISKQNNAKSLAELVTKKCVGKTVVYLKSDKSLNTFQAEIDSENIQLFETEVYRNLPVVQKLNADFDAWLFFSPSGIESFVDYGNIISESAIIFAIGNTTGNRAKQIFSNQVIESPIQEEKAFVEFAVKELNLLQPETSH